MRVQARPRFKASASVGFSTFSAGAAAVRELSQSGLWPSNCRLLDPDEAALSGASVDGALLVLGFESAHHPVDDWLSRALECCADHGGAERGERRGDSSGKDGGGGSDSWRSFFLQAPYLRG